MPKLSGVRYGRYQTCVLTFDHTGGHPYVGDPSMRPPDSLEIEYNPGWRTLEHFKRERELGPKDMEPILFEFLAVVKEWDAMDEAGNKIPLTSTALRDVSVDLMRAIIRGTDEATASPNPTMS